LKKFGECVGMAFQIKDDLFDYGDEEIGKPVGIDIKEKKMTLPLIHALSKAGWLEKRKIISLVKSGSEDQSKIKLVIDFVKKSGGIEYAKSKMEEYHQQALAVLEPLPASTYKSSLIDLVQFTIERKS
jgi:octaprenyl-diphosphate synthase